MHLMPNQYHVTICMCVCVRACNIEKVGGPEDGATCASVRVCVCVCVYTVW